ncbi:resolvase [Bacillus sp. MUM 116]|uniref:recombinase family protein n=1 Tax=Bacillus sp. MUM 116 TaxID=1678002 RepID=UPI0008F5827B|nr:recombinase family protein [Bacillus sp. MUM 116]OIK14569.1 resolvase [Bacillus sp. MUM 116]
MIYGYARISTQDQKLGLQTDALTQYGCDLIFEEVLSGMRVERPELDKLMDLVKPGDTVVVWKLDRIGRSVKHLVEIMAYFKENDIHFVSLQDNIDTSTAMGRFVFTIFAGLAEFEREMIVERTKAGLQAAKERGRLGGRPRKSKKRMETALKMYESREFTVNEICQQLNIGKSTFYRYLNRTERIK